MLYRLKFCIVARVCVAVGLSLIASHNALSAGTQKRLALPHPRITVMSPVGELPPTNRLHLVLGLPVRARTELDRFVQDLYDPASPYFQKFLTPEQFAERFSPSEADYQAVIDYVQKQGLAVRQRHANRIVLEIEGSVGQIEAMLQTKLRVYNHPTERRKFYSPSTEPIVPANLLLQDIQGLDDYVLPRPMSLHRTGPLGGTPQVLTGSGPGGAYRGYDFRAAYAPTVRLTGAGQVVGLLEFDGFYTNDIAKYEHDSGLAAVPLQKILLDGVNGVPNTSNGEVALDIETCIAMAPGLSKVIVYEGAYGNSVISRMATDNTAKQLSSSWTYTVNLTTEQLFSQLAAQGQTMFQASGDINAYYAQIPSPSDNPNITIVGGTTLTTSGPQGAWVSETTWKWDTNDGSSGGPSDIFSLPSYQNGLSMTLNQGSTLMRNLPDVALTADNVWIYDNNGSTDVVGGTSVAAPLWAGFMALVNQQAKAVGHANIGFFNPTLYALGKGAKYGASFHDITTGNNTDDGSPNKFYAVTGFDLCTGWGTPAGQPLINALTGVTNVAPVFLTNRIVQPNAAASQAYAGSITAAATDPDPNDKLSFSKTSGPAWLTVSATGQLSGIPTGSNLGTNTFGVKVTDAGGLSASSTLIIQVVAIPVFLSDPFLEHGVNVGILYAGSISNQASDPNPGATLTFSKLSGPAWLNVAVDGGLSGTPTTSDIGTNSFVINVSDSTGGSNNATMYLPVNGPPSFMASALLEGPASAGQPFSASIAALARDPNPGDALTFSKVDGAAWLNLGPDGTLIGTPGYSDAGTNVFGIRVTDSGGLSADAQLFVFVAAPTPTSLKIAINQGQVVVSWTGGNGKYQLQGASDLARPAWVNLGPVVNVQTLILPLTNSTQFYRVQSQ